MNIVTQLLRFIKNVVSLITMTYSIMISCFIFFPTKTWAENKIAALKDEA